MQVGEKEDGPDVLDRLVYSDGPRRPTKDSPATSRELVQRRRLVFAAALDELERVETELAEGRRLAALAVKFLHAHGRHTPRRGLVARLEAWAEGKQLPADEEEVAA